MIARAIVVSFLLICAVPAIRAADDIVVADFEGTNYGAWVTTGAAFGAGPARGALPGQMHVDGFFGKGLVNSFYGGDRSTGTLTSPPFLIERHYISFLIGGGGYTNETCMSLLVDGKVVRTATGPNIESGGSERLQPAGWDVAEFAGKQGVIQIVDQRTGGWGHINVDQIVLSDKKPILERNNAAREIAVDKKYLHFPVKNGAPRKKVEVVRDGEVVRFFDIELADAEPDWWAFLDVAPWKGEKLQVRVNRLRDNSSALSAISQGDNIKGAENLYRETLRPQLHFSPRRGWNNDPNGLVYYPGGSDSPGQEAGQYHLFFQHNPYGWNWGNMHWGHAVSADLVHWREIDEALYPDKLGPMFSGSAVVDWKNSSGFGSGGAPPLVLIYTAAGNPTVQCLAYSTDRGRTFTKYAGNPIVSQITPGNRDPKVFWHEPTHRWVMTLYVGFEEKKNGKNSTRHTIHFLTSLDLKQWTVASQIDGLFECPDFFELPVDGDAANKKWVLTAASSEYMVGAFDGRTFTPESPKLPGHRGKGFYAAQTYSDIPPADGRRIQIGWLQAPSPEMAFNQCMSLPLELKLLATPSGPRLSWWPVRLPKAFDHTPADSWTVHPGENLHTMRRSSGLLQVSAEFEPGQNSELAINVNGVPVIYDNTKQEIVVKGHRAPAPLRNGQQRLLIIADRTAFEVFASDGLTYVPMPAIPKAEDSGASISLKGAPLKSQSIKVAELRSIWE